MSKISRIYAKKGLRKLCGKKIGRKDAYSLGMVYISPVCLAAK
jgi:hypothetical protein